VGRFVRIGVLALACATLVAGCGGDDDTSSEAEQATTPSAVRNAIFERAFSECGSETVAELAGKHNVSRNSAAVSTAVAEFWAEYFGGHADAVREAKLACLQSIALESPPGQPKHPRQKKPTQFSPKQPPQQP
jgi:hypothetical protein